MKTLCKFLMGLLKTLDDVIWIFIWIFVKLYYLIFIWKIILINIYIFSYLGRVTNFVFNSSRNVQIRWINTEESDL